jgi:hypothetical protein
MRPTPEQWTSQYRQHLRTIAREASRKPLAFLSEFLSCKPQNAAMLENEKLQIAGPVSIICAIFCAEAGALALASWPASPLLWYLNLELFRAVQYSFSGFGVTPWFGNYSLAIWIAISLLTLVSAGLFFRVRMPLAIASNFSFIYSICLLCGSYAASGAATSFGFRWSGLWTPSTALAIAVLLISFLSSTISHRSYLREIFA